MCLSNGKWDPFPTANSIKLLPHHQHREYIVCPVIVKEGGLMNAKAMREKTGLANFGGPFNSPKHYRTLLEFTVNPECMLKQKQEIAIECGIVVIWSIVQPIFIRQLHTQLVAFHQMHQSHIAGRSCTFQILQICPQLTTRTARVVKRR